MNKQTTTRIERIGAILAIAESAQLPALQGYLKDFHEASWDLVSIDRGARGKAAEAPNSRGSLIKAYRAWLIRHDNAWTLVDEMLKRPSLNDWDRLAELTGKSAETCRQIIQALKRGGMS